MIRNRRFQPLTDVWGYIVYDRHARCEVGHYATMGEAASVARLLCTEADHQDAVESFDRRYWQALTR